MKEQDSLAVERTDSILVKSSKVKSSQCISTCAGRWQSGLHILVDGQQRSGCTPGTRQKRGEETENREGGNDNWVGNGTVSWNVAVGNELKVRCFKILKGSGYCCIGLKWHVIVEVRKK